MTNPKFAPSEIIQALAGSGKTQLLAYRFLRLMKLGANPTTILATTFSRKAAGEIRDRIVEMLSKAILDPDSLEELVQGVPEIENGKEDCALLLTQFVSSLHRLNIGTIDSFFVKTAMAFSDTLQMSQGWSILDEVNKEQVFDDAISRLTKDETASTSIARKLFLSKSGAKVPINKTIESIQKSAFSAIRDIDEGVWLWGVLQKEISQEDLESAIQFLSEIHTEITSHQKAIVKAIEHLRSRDWEKFLSQGLTPKIIDKTNVYSRVEIETNIMAAYEPLINHAYGVIGNKIIQKNVSTYQLMKLLDQFWLEAKHDHALYSFDDITHALGQMGEAGKGGVMHDLVELQYRLDGSIDHMLVDEFQDTSLPQWNVLWPLIEEIYQAQQDRSLFIVGDVKQSLYGFRGGEPAILRELESKLECANTIRLEKSWRCSTPVLEAVNKVFGEAHNAALLTDHAPDAPSAWQEDFQTHVSAAPSRKGYAEILTAGDDPEELKNPLQLCTEKVVEIVTGIRKEAPSSHIGILVRSNTKQQIQRIVHALRTCDEKVFAAEFGGNPLTDSPAVTVILSALLMADDACNTVSVFHVQSSPLGEHLGIGYTSSEEVLKQVSRTIHRRLLREGYASVIQEFAEQLIDAVDERERLRLWQLVEFAEQQSPNVTLRPSKFVALVKETQIPDPVSSQVQVMTVHKSKGLSFDSVIVCDLDQSLWKTPQMMQHRTDPCDPPIYAGMYAPEFIDNHLPKYAKMRSEAKSTQVHEALCLLYVAMTRAKHSLHMVIPSRKKAKSHYKKLDGLLLQILDEDQNQSPNTIVWEANSNDGDWIEDLREETYSELPAPIEPFEIKPPSLHDDLISGVSTVSPSSLEGGGISKISERFSGDTNAAFDWGTVIHKWFEDVDWLGDIPAIDLLLESAPREEAGRLGEERLIQAAESHITACKSKEIKALLTKPSDNVVAYREQKFALRISAGTKFAGVEMNEITDVHGSIDRLVVYNDVNGKPSHAEVID
ncbi:MAG: UvrD-helicase domain-containing protein, partial [Planctomycetota bacterium]|nr:UvrD-helicase domain-containing protein [Planctomycetota bacterium]